RSSRTIREFSTSTLAQNFSMPTARSAKKCSTTSVTRPRRAIKSGPRRWSRNSSNCWARNNAVTRSLPSEVGFRRVGNYHQKTLQGGDKRTNSLFNPSNCHAPRRFDRNLGGRQHSGLFVPGLGGV